MIDQALANAAVVARQVLGAVRPEAVAFGVAPSDVRDSQNPDPVHGTGSYRANATPGTNGCVSAKGWGMVA